MLVKALKDWKDNDKIQSFQVNQPGNIYSQSTIKVQITHVED